MFPKGTSWQVPLGDWSPMAIITLKAYPTAHLPPHIDVAPPSLRPITWTPALFTQLFWGGCPAASTLPPPPSRTSTTWVHVTSCHISDIPLTAPLTWVLPWLPAPRPPGPSPSMPAPQRHPADYRCPRAASPTSHPHTRPEPCVSCRAAVQACPDRSLVGPSSQDRAALGRGRSVL